MARSIILGSVATIALGCSPALCAAPAAGALEPRYSVEGTRLEAAPSHDSVDGRYRLEARLRQDETQQTGSGITLNAKLVAAATAACDTSGLIFADSFE